MKNSKIVYMGTPEFAVAPLKSLLAAGYNICAVVTAPDKPVGRGQKIAQSDVKKYAVENNLRVLQPESFKDPELIAQLKALDAHIFIVVAFRMLPKAVWSIPKLGTFNLHASLLPMYRGAAPINWAIINGETISGVTTFLIDENIDTGKILFKQECEIAESDNAGDLHDKLMNMGANLVIKTVAALIKGEVNAIEQQNYTNCSELKIAPKLTKETGAINWQLTSLEIANLIRGLSPYPAAHSILENATKLIPVKIFEAAQSNSSTKLLPGQIETDGKNYLRAGCANGSLDIISLQAAGKKRLFIKDFLAGFKDAQSYSFSLEPIAKKTLNTQENAND